MTRRRRLTARPRYSTRPAASLNRYTPGARGSRTARSRGADLCGGSRRESRPAPATVEAYTATRQRLRQDTFAPIRWPTPYVTAAVRRCHAAVAPPPGYSGPGSRLAHVTRSMAPILAAVLGWLALGLRVRAQGWIAPLLAFISWVEG